MQDEKIAQLDKMISVLYNHVPVSELDEVKREMEEITSQSKTNNKDIDKNQEVR